MISLRSSLRRKLLTYFLANRSARVYVRQLATMLAVDSTNLSRELSRLEAEGLLRSEMEGRQRFYLINSHYPYLQAVLALLQGSVGIEATLRSTLQRVGGIECAYLYGSFAKNEQDGFSDIDLLVVGSPDMSKLATEVRSAEKILSREVNYTILSSQELNKKLASNHPFISDVWHGRRIELIGHDQDKATASQRGAGKAVSR